MRFNETKLKLIHLLADGDFHSGSKLAALLGVSRSAVWKQIEGFADIGVEIVAVSGKGYRLTQPLELLNQSTIEALLSPPVKTLLNGLEIHHQIDSTNRYLVNSVEQGCCSGMVCLAEMQTAGKGRLGRQWISPFGRNIYLSLLWRFSEGPGALSGLSLAIGVAVVRALKKSGVHNIGLKWPNDIYWRKRKLGGILVEVLGEANGPCSAVIGLGINFYIPERSAQSIDQDWTDLEHILGQTRPSRNAMVSGILNELAPIVEGFDKTGLKPYLDEWRGWDCMCGESVTLSVGNSKVRGEVSGITDDGLLILRDQQGRFSNFASGEVSFHEKGA